MIYLQKITPKLFTFLVLTSTKQMTKFNKTETLDKKKTKK